jgi:hypothetical protein
MDCHDEIENEKYVVENVNQKNEKRKCILVLGWGVNRRVHDFVIRSTVSIGHNHKVTLHEKRLRLMKPVSNTIEKTQ